MVSLLCMAGVKELSDITLYNTTYVIYNERGFMFRVDELVIKNIMIKTHRMKQQKNISHHS